MEPRLCLPCARAKLAGKTAKPCGDCILLNVDRLAIVRSNHSRPDPKWYALAEAPSFSSLVGGPSSKPAHSNRSGQRGA